MLEREKSDMHEANEEMSPLMQSSLPNDKEMMLSKNHS